MGPIQACDIKYNDVTWKKRNELQQTPLFLSRLLQTNIKVLLFLTKAKANCINEYKEKLHVKYRSILYLRYLFLSTNVLL